MKQEMLKLVKATFLCVCYCCIIAIIISIMLRVNFLSEQKAFLYRLLIMDAICCFILLLVCFAIVVRKGTILGMGLADNIMIVGLSTLFMALFLSLGPMTIERSYTIYSLANMTENAATVYSAEEIKQQFISGYIEEAGESQKRIDEQVYIGNLLEVDGGYRISEKGKRLIKIFRMIENIFPVPDKNSIYPNGY